MNEEVQTEEQATGQPIADNDLTAENQETKTFTQDELDRIVKERLAKERKRVEKQFEGVDVNEYRQLMEQQENERLEQQKARGEFEKVLQQTVEKKDSTIQQLQQELHSIKVDGNLLNAASTKGAINPQQVVALLKSNVKLGDTGDVEVLDTEGNVRYTDAGTTMSVDDLVEEFITTNPHFKSAGPSGSGSRSNVADSAGSTPGKVDTSKLNMNDPKDREIYREYMRSKGIRL